MKSDRQEAILQGKKGRGRHQSVWQVYLTDSMPNLSPDAHFEEMAVSRLAGKEPISRFGLSLGENTRYLATKSI